MADNFSEIVKLCRVEEENQVSRATQAEEDALEMQVRASNMVRAGESLMKLVSDLKIYLILNDFPNVNEAISSNSSMFKEMQVKLTKLRRYVISISNFISLFQTSCDRNLTSLRDDLATDLFELEEEYYSSSYKWLTFILQFVPFLYVKRSIIKLYFNII